MAALLYEYPLYLVFVNIVALQFLQEAHLSMCYESSSTSMQITCLDVSDGGLIVPYSLLSPKHANT